MFLWCFAAQAGTRVTVIVTITNTPTANTQSLTLNASTRVWTNDVSSSPGTLIATTNNTALSATNLINHLTLYPFSSGQILSQTATNNVRIAGLVDQTMSASLAGNWGVITYSTQTVSSPTFVVRVPYTVEAVSNRATIGAHIIDYLGQSNLAHWAHSIKSGVDAGNEFFDKTLRFTNEIGLWFDVGLSDQLPEEDTNYWGMASLFNANGILYLRYGTGVTDWGQIIWADNGAGDHGSTIRSPITSNLVNYGNAIRSHGAGTNSLQVGSNALSSATTSMAVGNDALANGLRAISVGNAAIATNTDALAIGTGAKATNQSATAIGNAARASGADSLAVGTTATVEQQYGVALGSSTIAGGLSDVAIGTGTEAQGGYAIAILGSTGGTATNGVAIGRSSFANHSNSVALGPNASTTATNEIVLGFNHQIRAGSSGWFEGNIHSNSTLKGINTWNGDVAYTPRVNGALANGNNSGVLLGTNVYLRLMGPSAAYTNAGFLAERDGSWHTLQFTNPAANMTILNDSGLDATAANRILTGSGFDLNFTNNPVLIDVLYDGAASRWRLKLPR